jgi:transposase InsO family protein
MTLEQLAELKRFVPYYESGSISSSYVALHFDITRQHARRLMRAARPPVGRIAHNRLRDEIRNFIAQEKRAYPHKNCQWISEIASDRFEQSVSRSSVYRVLRDEDLLVKKPISHKPRSRFEAERTGDLIQMDTSCGDWAGGKRIYVTVLLDDYSRYILKGEFAWHDGLAHSLRMIKETAKQYGRFRLLYTDNASWFKVIRHNQSMYQTHKSEGEYESQITRACREAGITHLTHKPYEPQSKGKIERLFGFIQKRFVPAICDDWALWKINVEFQCWIDWYNSKHVNRTTHQTAEKRFDPSGFTPLLAEYNLDDIFCLKDTRKVDKCNQFSYQGTQYTIKSDLILSACKVNLCIIPEKSIRVFWQNKFVCELPINQQLN